MHLFEIYQIYYNEKSKANCYDFTRHYFNQKCSVFFENEVISNLINDEAHKQSEYFGVLSHLHRAKMPGRTKVNAENLKKFLEEKRPELLSFQIGDAKTIFPKSKNYHPKFLNLFSKMIEKTFGEPFNPEFIPSIYIMFNSFLAKSEVYERYVREALSPCIEKIRTDEELNTLVMQNGNYHAAVLRFRDNPKLKEQLGIDYYPYIPFLLERLPCWYFSQKNLKYEYWK